MITSPTVLKKKFLKDQIFHVLYIVVIWLSIVSCSSDDDDGGDFDFPLTGSELSISDIAGNWTAQFAEFQIPGSSAPIEIISEGGSFNLTIQNNGRFSAQINFPGEPTEQFTGQMGFSDSLLVLLDDEDEPGDEAFLTISLTPEDLLLANGILEFDFDGDGSFEDTIIDLRMER